MAAAGAAGSPPTSCGRTRAVRAQGIADRAAELGDRVDVERPSWARPLGDRPAEPVPARDWDRAATFAAAYREQFGIDDDDQVLGERVDAGTRGKAWQSADDAVRTVCPRRFSEVSDRKLAAKITGWQRIQQDAASAKTDLEKIRAKPGTFVTVAERENAADRAGAEYARAVQAVKAMREEIEREAQVLRDREAELAGTGRFAGGKRKALGGEIAALKAAQEARMSSLTDAEANVGQPVPRVHPDSSEAAVAARCEQRLAAAQAAGRKHKENRRRHAAAKAAAVGGGVEGQPRRGVGRAGVPGTERHRSAGRPGGAGAGAGGAGGGSAGAAAGAAGADGAVRADGRGDDRGSRSRASAWAEPRLSVAGGMQRSQPRRGPCHGSCCWSHAALFAFVVAGWTVIGAGYLVVGLGYLLYGAVSPPGTSCSPPAG